MHFRQAGFSHKARGGYLASLALLAAPVWALPPSGGGPPAPKVAPVLEQKISVPVRIAPKKRPPARESAPPAIISDSAAPAESTAKTAPAKVFPPAATSGPKGPPEFADAWPSE